MTTRAKTIPLANFDLAENEKVINSSIEENQVVLTIATPDDLDERRRSGRKFLEFVEQMNLERPIDWEALDNNPDPRLRAILDSLPSEE